MSDPTKMSDPDYIYDPDDWEYTCHWKDRADVADDCSGLRHVRDVKRFHTLVEGPPKFAAKVPTEFDEDGELRWFDSEAEARAACGMPAYMTAG